MKELLEGFEQEAKKSQLFVLQPNTCAMMYSRNPKKGNYTGFFYDIPVTKSFNYENFLLKHALPGPKSVIHCILEPKGQENDPKHIWL